MTKYVIKRIFMALVTIWAVATITFFLMNMVPGGPFLSEKAISPQAQAALEAKYGLDKPLYEQYVTYLKDASHGDFGDSLKQRGRSVMGIILTKFPVSARVGGVAILVSLCIGIPLGCIAALNRGKVLDNLISVIATGGIAIPSFVICTLLMYFFGVRLKVFPTFGLSSWKHYVMPVISLSLYPMAYIMRLMRSAMLDVLGQDYMRTARAKGVNQFKSVFKHALRNAILPVITYVGPMTAYTLVGSFIVEKIFTIPGLGSEFIGSITSRDYTLIMGTTIFLATIMVIMNVIVDIIYKLVDPRIKLN
ncbi:ABC transporter permease [Candidatus Galacturonibacter soehngenii]|uniref:ABC transporter permease n=1 Tax=Candidatus Galacturonatibacter soehngenii TaxID=2307010 RepID=A0A7V7QI35_9FIRM|nr:ABC transporter permease [Candidatus Galacturonibacter soehngenii]KAB1434347.1 ABC transporter permease [Candidatus Galacturonibacter soehngenii]